MAKIGYVRVSTKEQNTDRQIDILSEYKLDKIFIEKVSGATTNRAEFNVMIDYIRDGDVLYVESLSRLARSTRDLLQTVETLQIKNVALISLKENFDTSTPQGRLILTMFSALSEFERDCMLERQREGLESAKRRGVKFGRKRIELPQNWSKVIKQWENKEITAVEAMKKTDLNRSTFYRRYKEFKIK